jgi:hypothetical protein
VCLLRLRQSCSCSCRWDRACVVRQYAVAAQRGSLPLANPSIVLCDLEEGPKGLWVLQQLCNVR